MRGAIRVWLWLCALVVSMVACGGGTSIDPTGGGAGAAGGGVTVGAGGAGTGGAGATSTGAAGAGGEGGAAPATGSVVVGVTSQLTDTDMADLHVIMRVNGAVVEERTYGPGGIGPIAFPLELAFSDLPGGDEVEVELSATDPYIDIDFPPQEQRAKTTVVVGETLLLRLTLTFDCSPWLGFPSQCAAPLTCSWGSCRDAYAPPAALEMYSPSWASFSYCKPEDAGAPIVLLGTGLSDYTPINDMDVVVTNAGPQGGHHIWVALRMKNLRQMSTVTLSGYVPDLDLDIGPIAFSQGFGENVAAGYCELLAIVFQLDATVDISMLLGLGMDMSVQMTDQDGATAGDMKSFTISNTINP